MILARGPAKEAGFTIIEVLVAATLLLVGMLGVVTMVNGANSAVGSAREREAATNLAREIAEQARSIPYSQVDAATLEPKLQAMAGLASSTPAPTWTVTRRGTTYEVDATVCSIDDTRDGLGDHSDGGFCDTATGTADSTARDLQRVQVDVTWDDRGVQRSVRQVATLSPGNGRDAPRVKTLTATSPTFPDPTQPVVTATSTTQVTFTVTGSATATRIIWSLDGVDQVPAPVAAGAPKTWTFTLPLAGLSDGTYSIGARAADANDVEGPPHEIPLQLLRGIPAAPTITASGFNTVGVSGVQTDVVEIEWLSNTERNVEGYRVYRPNGSLACPGDLATSDERLECVDTAPVAGEYTVTAIFRAADGSIGEGVHARTTPVGFTTIVPPTPERFTFTSTSASSSSCPASTGGAFQMSVNPTLPATATSRLLPDSPRFCSPLATSTRTMPSSPSGSPTTKVSVWLRNAHNGRDKLCTVSAVATFPGVGTVSAQQSPVIGPMGSDPSVERVFTFAHSSFTVPAGERFYVTFDDGGACDKTYLDFASTTRPAYMEYMQPGTTVQTPRPGAPTNLQITATTEGPRLTWTAPTSGAPVENYRIYRGGTDYTDRYDKTGDTIPEYSDPKPKAGERYWVTAVGPNLAESPMAGPVTTP